MSPLDRQACCQLTHGCFRCVVRCLRLRHIDDRSRHGPDHHDTAFGLAIDKMASHGCGPQISAVDIYAPKPPHAVWGIRNGVKVFSEPCGSDQVVDLAMLLDNLFDCGIDRVGVRHVRIMRRDFRNTEVLSV